MAQAFCQRVQIQSELSLTCTSLTGLWIRKTLKRSAPLKIRYAFGPWNCLQSANYLLFSSRAITVVLFEWDSISQLNLANWAVRVVFIARLYCRDDFWEAHWPLTLKGLTPMRRPYGMERYKLQAERRRALFECFLFPVKIQKLMDLSLQEFFIATILCSG